MRITKDTPLATMLEIGKHCDRCGHCCSHSSGALIDDDAKKLAEHLNITEEKLKEKYLEEIEKFNTKRFRPKLIRKKGMPYGRCIFLKGDNLCSIHEAKPAECRIGTCSKHGEEASIWFTLNHFVDKHDPISIRQWDIYLETHPTIPGGKTEDLIKDCKKLKKIREYDEYRHTMHD